MKVRKVLVRSLAREALRQYLDPITVRPSQENGVKAYVAEGTIDATEALGHTDFPGTWIGMSIRRAGDGSGEDRKGQMRTDLVPHSSLMRDVPHEPHRSS